MSEKEKMKSEEIAKVLAENPTAKIYLAGDFLLSVEVTECKPLSERIKNVEANYIMQSGKWILSAYQFSRKWDNENNAIRRNLNAWVRPALRFVHQMKKSL